MLKQIMVAICAVLIVAAGEVPAQAPPQAPKPGPEHKRLQYFLGNWSAQYEMKPSAFGAGGKGTGMDRNQMLPGGFFVVMHSDGKGPMGVINELAVMGYNADEKVYTYNAYNNWGEAEKFTGTVQGDTWTWTSETKINGKPTKAKFTLREVSPTSYTYRFDTSDDGAAWTNVMEGKATKLKPKTK